MKHSLVFLFLQIILMGKAKKLIFLSGDTYLAHLTFWKMTNLLIDDRESLNQTVNVSRLYFYYLLLGSGCCFNLYDSRRKGYGLEGIRTPMFSTIALDLQSSSFTNLDTNPKLAIQLSIHYKRREWESNPQQNDQFYNCLANRLPCQQRSLLTAPTGFEPVTIKLTACCSTN